MDSLFSRFSIKSNALCKLIAVLFIILSINLYISSISYASDFGTGTATPPPPPDDDDDDDDDDKEENATPPTTDCDDNGSGDTGKTGNPVSLYSGAEEFSRIDVKLNGLFPMELKRTYNSQSKYDSPLGYGWAFTYDRRLFEYPDQSIIIRYGCGKKSRFVYTGGTYQPLGGMRGTLKALAGGNFVFTHRRGMKDFYDTQGRLTAKENQQGHRLEFTYDPRGKLPLTGTSTDAVITYRPLVTSYHYRLLKIEEKDAETNALTGKTITFTYSENTGRLATAQTNDGRLITYEHDVTDGLTKGDLVDVYGLNGHHSNYSYSGQNKHNISRIIEGDNSIPYDISYYQDDRVSSISLGAYGQEGYTPSDITYVNGVSAQVTKTVNKFKTNEYTVETEYWFDPITKKTSRYEDEEGNWFEYDYDALGYKDVARIYHNQGTKQIPVRVLQKTIDYTYDSEGNKISEIVALDDVGNGIKTITKSWTYDFGRLTSEQVVSSFSPEKIFRTEYTYYRDGDNVPINIKEIRKRKDDGSYLVTTRFYDSNNRLIKEVMPDGHVMRTLYENGSLYRTWLYHEKAGVLDPFAYARFSYDAKGDVSGVWDADANLTQFVYDEKQRLSSTTNAKNEETTYTYLNNRIQQIEVGKTVADGEGQIIKFVYSNINRLQEIQRKNDVSQFITQVSYTYDSENRKLTETDGDGQVTKYEYDLNGRLAKVIDPLLKETTYKRDATNRIISIIDANLNETKFSYDDLGRIIQIEQLGTSPVITKLTYDAIGNLTSVTDGKNQTTQYTYDTLSRKTSEIKPLGQTIQYFYGDRSRLDYMLNARGQKIDYIYEEWGPVKTINYYADNSTTTIDRTINLTYDNPGTVISISDSSIGAGSLYSYGYDVLNRRTATTIYGLPGANKTIGVGYDRFGNRNALTLNDNSGSYGHTYTFNKLNNLQSAVLPGSQVFSSTSYFNNNNLKQLTTPSGIVTDYLYETNGAVKDIKFTDSISAGIIEQFVYTYDNVRNIDTITEAVGLHDYNYDEFYRLTQAIHPAGLGIPIQEDYTYDTASNREDPANSLLYDYDANNRITTSPGVTSYAYDNEGNVETKSGGEVFAYDHNSRLISYTKTGVNASYQYDPAGRRISKTVNGITTWYLWDGTQLLAEYDNAGAQLKRYAYMPNQFTPAQVAIGANIYDVHSDHLQTPKLLTDSSRNTVWQANYESFGNVNLAVNTVEFNLRYPGQYYDGESGLHYNYFRTYDPNLGRYITSDPIGLYGGLNTYGYVGGNPLKFVDPLGLQRTRSFNPANTGQGANGWSIGVGGCIGMVCSSVDSDTPTQTDVDLSTPSLGAGIKICLNNRGNGNSDPCDKNKDDPNVTVTMGLGRNLGVSVSNSKTCLNIGPSIGLPITISGSNGTL